MKNYQKNRFYGSCIAALVLSLQAGLIHAETYGSELPEEASKSTITGIKVVPKPSEMQVKQSAFVQGAQSGAFTLRKGESIKEELEKWAESAGWVVDWQLASSWIVPNGMSFDGDFKNAATNVIRSLAENGIVIRCVTNDANKTMLVFGASVREQ